MKVIRPQRKKRLKPNSNRPADKSGKKPAEKPIRSVRNSALDILARREHTRLELTRKLKAKDFTDDEIEAQMQVLIQDGLQSDERYAETYVHMRRKRGYGPLKIQQELQQRGVSSDLVEAFVEFNDKVWLETACQAYEKKFGAMSMSGSTQGEANSAKERAKRMRFLQSRGFTGDIIQKIFSTFGS
jgi:regulatory protein